MVDREAIDRRIITIMIEDGPDGHCDGHEIITDYVMSLLEPLITLLREAKREHAFTLGPRLLNEQRGGVIVKGCRKGAYAMEPCTCGADAWNARVDAALSDHER